MVGNGTDTPFTATATTTIMTMTEMISATVHRAVGVIADGFGVAPMPSLPGIGRPDSFHP